MKANVNPVVQLVREFLRDDCASTLIETAFIAPVLVAITLGGVEAGAMYSRQTELQQVASNAMEIILTSAPKTEQEGAATIAQVRQYAAATSGLQVVTGSTPALGQVAVYKRYRCGNNSERQAEYGCANSTQTISTFVVVVMRENYSPVWRNFGIGQDLQFNVKRTVQIG